MAERELYNNMNAEPFPFDAASSVCSQYLKTILHKIQNDDRQHNQHPPDTFVTAINAILVWTGARTASLPTWDNCDKTTVENFIKDLNYFSRQISANVGHHVDELCLLYRYQTYRDGCKIRQAFIVRHNCPRVRWTGYPPIGDEEIGRELDMYPLNAAHFAINSGGWTPSEVFSVMEVDTKALLYAEVVYPDYLNPQQKEEFRVHCEKRIKLWNSAMENLDLSYRFYGTLV